MRKLGFQGMSQIFVRFLHDRRGATAIEYGLFAALISIAVVGSGASIGSGVAKVLDILNLKFSTLPAAR